MRRLEEEVNKLSRRVKLSIAGFVAIPLLTGCLYMGYVVSVRSPGDVAAIATLAFLGGVLVAPVTCLVVGTRAVFEEWSGRKQLQVARQAVAAQGPAPEKPTEQDEPAELKAKRGRLVTVEARIAELRAALRV